MTAYSELEQVGSAVHHCNIIKRDAGVWQVYYMWGGHIDFTLTRWGAIRVAKRHLRRHPA